MGLGVNGEVVAVRLVCGDSWVGKGQLARVRQESKTSTDSALRVAHCEPTKSLLYFLSVFSCVCRVSHGHFTFLYLFQLVSFPSIHQR